MKYKNQVVMLVVSLLLLACTGNNKKHSAINEIFVTNISTNGTKFFSYSVSMGEPGAGNSGNRMGKGKHGGNGGMGGGMRSSQAGGGANSDARKERMKEKINEKLKLRLAENRYCREGYLELDVYIGKGKSQIRGECQEGATEGDRKKFINTGDV